MFLEDKLLEIGRQVDMSSDDSILDTIKEMTKTCQKKIIEGINTNSTDKAVINTFRRVNKTWIKAVMTLESEGKDFVKVDGFKTFAKYAYEKIYNELGL